MDHIVDGFNRRIDYLRVSITDRCNLRCMYCMPPSGMKIGTHDEILSYEEILRIVRAAAAMGVTKVRITGGEPLLRRNLLNLIGEIRAVPGIADLGLTTNGVLLKTMAGALWEAGLRRINVSLDTLNSLKFRKITGRDHHRDVLEGIARAEELGFSPIKLNTVVMKGVNDDELVHFARMAVNRPYAVRFIEYMPVGGSLPWDRSKFVAATEIKEQLEAVGPLVPVPRARFDGPSERFRFQHGKGEIGLIGAVSKHFCHTCNRLRLTSDGKLRPCLLSDDEVDVRTALREGCSDEEIRRLICGAVARKTERRRPATGGIQQSGRSMSCIGG